ncbi:MAG TPA: hypothetical protein VFM33_11290 [Aquabacterium sp.]|nr:hypothetical protein [Aquabacterium sp.]
MPTPKQAPPSTAPDAPVQLNWGPPPVDATLPAKAEDPELRRWHELASQIGRELAEPLTAALERITTLMTTGRIDRAGLRALHQEIEQARQAGIWSQQIARLASGRVRQSLERVHLTHTVQSVLAYRARELQGKGITLTQALLPVEIQVDASMLFSLLNNLVDWWLENALGHVEVQVDCTHWPERARLRCKFKHQPADQSDTVNLDERYSAMTSMNWHVLDQTARTMGVVLDRQINATQVNLSLEFPNVVSDRLSQLDWDDQDQGFADSVNSKPLAGSHVLVVAARRDLRIQIREALKSMGLVLDFVTSVKEAIDFCREGLPHAIVFDNGLHTFAFDKLVQSIRKEVPEFVFIELLDGGHTFDISSVSQTGMARVGREAVATALPSALVYELTRVM